MDDKPLYKPFPSKAKNKKFSVYVMKDGKKRLIHFGDSSMTDKLKGASKDQQKSINDNGFNNQSSQEIKLPKLKKSE